MKTAVYPGSFNPVHPGHMHVILQASRIFDHVTVLVAVNPGKTYRVSPQKRKELIEHMLEKMPCSNVSVDITDKSLMEYYNGTDAVAVVRGIRNGADLEVERAQQKYNMLLNTSKRPLTYVYFAPSEQFEHLSSTYVRQFIGYCTRWQLVELYGGPDFIDDDTAGNIISLYKE